MKTSCRVLLLFQEVVLGKGHAGPMVSPFVELCHCVAWMFQKGPKKEQRGGRQTGERDKRSSSRISDLREDQL